MLPLFNSTETLLPFILIIVAFAMWVQRFKAFKYIGPAMTVVVIGIVCINLRIVAPWSDVYGVIITYCVPAAISLYLLNMDMSQLKKLGREPAIAIIVACASVSIVATLLGLIFAPLIPEGWKVAGMFVGTYTGGSANLTAIAVGLGATEDTIAAANASDYVIGMPTMLLLFASPAIIGASKWWQRKWPYRFSKEEYVDNASSQLLEDEKWNIMDIAILLAIAFSIVTASTLIANKIFPASFTGPGRILLLSTLSLIAAQIPAVKKLRGTFNLGLFFSLQYLVIIGFMVNIQNFLGSAMYMTIFCLCVIVSCIFLHMVILRLLKVKYEYMVISITGAIAEGTTAALVAAGGGWKNLVGAGILMGLIGAMAGNYLGIAVAYIVKALIGA